MKTLLIILSLCVVDAKAGTLVTVNEVDTNTISALASTQTFTGPKTFTNSVTVSSLTATGNTSFNSAASTMTISGWIDNGWERIVQLTSGANIVAQANCSAGKRVMGGGFICDSGFSQYSYPLSTGGGWYVLCSSAAASNAAYAICARVK